MESVRRYITTTLPYVNNDPHIGFAFELIEGDTLARYFRARYGEDTVFFSTGTDEHGQKIAEKADEKGEDRQAYVDHYAHEVERLKETLNLSNNAFIRTTSESHKAAAQELWRRCAANGDIYKKTYKGLYCVGDEVFMKESDLVDGRCPNHPDKELQVIEEENYFFRLTKYQTYLEEYLSREDVVVPEWRRQEALNFVTAGLEDFSISRKKSRMDWGIPVPDDDEQIMYVWFDALTNYISTLGWPKEEGNFNTFWKDGETIILGGKDQVRFQSIMWQAMLKSADLPATDRVIYHGFINSDGRKMSKSLGNVISPYELTDRYGTDATRYLLLRHMHPFDDSDITWEKLDEWYTADLVNGLGNLTARILKMSETHLEPCTYAGGEDVHLEGFETYNLQQVLTSIWSRIQALDERITETEPFKLIKTDETKAKELINGLRIGLYDIACLLLPCMPETSEVIREAIRMNKKPENLFSRLD
jgi:methionyl-tRNA synthetase